MQGVGVRHSIPETVPQAARQECHLHQIGEASPQPTTLRPVPMPKDPLENTAWDLGSQQVPLPTQQYCCLRLKELPEWPGNAAPRGGPELVRSPTAQQCRPGHPTPAPKLLSIPDQPAKEVLSPHRPWAGQRALDTTTHSPVWLSAEGKDTRLPLPESWPPPKSLATGV